MNLWTVQLNTNKATKKICVQTFMWSYAVFYSLADDRWIAGSYNWYII